MKVGKVRDDILEYLKAQQYVSVHDALYFLAHVESIPSPPATLLSRKEFTSCLRCKNAFSDSNVFTSLGWKETQISGFCETCFDTVTKERYFEGEDE